MDPDETMVGQPVEILASHHPTAGEMGPYERVLSDAMKGNSIAGFGIYATRTIRKGDIIFCGEEKAQRLVTRRFVENNWNEEQKQIDASDAQTLQVRS